MIERISFEEYCKRDGVNASLLCELLPPKTPQHFKAWLDGERKDTDDMLVGRLLHAVALDGFGLESICHIQPKDMKLNTVEGKAWKAAHSDKEIVKEKRAENIVGMFNALKSHIYIQDALAVSDKEVSVFHRDELFNVTRKIRLDILPRATFQELDFDGEVIGKYRPLLDLKKCRSAAEWDFSKQIWERHYHVRAAYYLDTYNAAFPNDQRNAFVLIAIEEEYPHCIALHKLNIGSAEIEQGRKEYQRALKLFIECSQKNDWPGYYPQPRPISLPKYALEKTA